MQITLSDTSRTSMLFIGDLGQDGTYPIMLTIDDPGPKNIDLDSIGTQEKRQLLYNYNCGNLLIKDADKYLELLGHVIQTTPTTTVPVLAQSFTEITKQKRKIQEIELKKYLKKHWASIKKEIPTMDLMTLRQLTDLEKSGKKRKGLIKTLEKAITTYSKEVSDKLAGNDISNMVYDPNAVTSTNVSDVVESNVVEETFLIPSEEDLTSG